MTFCCKRTIGDKGYQWDAGDEGCKADEVDEGDEGNEGDKCKERLKATVKEQQDILTENSLMLFGWTVMALAR